MSFTEIVVSEEVQLENAILLEGLPGVGNVGKLAAAHLIEELGATKCTEIYSSHFPPQVLIEESILGWQEHEYEVMRDAADNCIIVCSIENVDPLGVHTGDSITVAPAMTLTDREYQRLRNISIGVIREVGVDTGGCNIQFAVNPVDGRIVVIEMNPRVSRSSALASKATGFPIAKIAAKVAIGYTLDEIPNDITAETPASFEPTLDYVVVKVPRFAFEKFPGADPTLTTHMKSVGEAMAIGRNFTEALQKALRSLESKDAVFDWAQEWVDLDKKTLLREIATPHDGRLKKVMDAIRAGATPEEIFDATAIDPWFVDQLALINEIAVEVTAAEELTPSLLRKAKRHGFSDAQIGKIRGMSADVVRGVRHALGIRPVYKTVDTCAAEFAARTPYHYSSYDEETEVAPREKEAVIILGSGPNRIGQGIEFDYSCVHASLALSEAGYETVMVNCNPETVSTDYDTSDRLYFEPLTAEDVANVIDAERPIAVIVSLGGQTPLKLASTLPPGLIAGTSPESIDRAEDREQWNVLCSQLGIPQPPGGTAVDTAGALAVAGRIGYPVLVRPSYVLGGRGMEIVYDDAQLARAMAELSGFGSLGIEGGLSVERPVLVDRFLEDATEVDVDAIRDHLGEVVIGAVMEHVEEAGVHSGDSACVIPPPHLSAAVVERIEEHTRAIAEALDVRGPVNVQYAVKDDEVYVIEANPRASRTLPFVAKATGVPLAKVASRVMMGATLDELRLEGLLRERVVGDHVAVKEAVLPFDRFPDADPLLGPEMRSTGEVMGIDLTTGLAFTKSQIAAGGALPDSGTVFMSLADRDKAVGLEAARGLVDLGLDVVATSGTAEHLVANGVPVTTVVAKLGEDGVDAVELIRSGSVQMVVNSPRGRGPRSDGEHIRAAAGAEGIPLLTTANAALAAARGLADWRRFPLAVRTLQEYHEGIVAAPEEGLR